MLYMMCRTRVADYATWKAVFDSHQEAHREAGLELADLWRCTDEPNNVFFLFEVADRGKADAFIHSPDSARAKNESGAIDGEYHFVERAPGY